MLWATFLPITLGEQSQTRKKSLYMLTTLCEHGVPMPPPCVSMGFPCLLNCVEAGHLQRHGSGLLASGVQWPSFTALLSECGQ